METSRRRALAAMVGGLAAMLGAARGEAKPACRREGHPCEGNQVCCSGLVCAPSGPGVADRCTASCADDCPASEDASVTEAAAYSVEVSCDYDSAADQTTCAFAGAAEGEATSVTAVILLAADVCGGIVGGSYVIVEPEEDGTSGKAYKSRGRDKEGRPSCTLVFSGEITVVGTATYWCETADGTFPAEGAGLACPEEAAPDDISDSTGAILVHSFTCPSDTYAPSYDWYAGCDPGGDSVEFRLTPAAEAESGEERTGAIDAEGVTRFGKLQPGTYRLDQVEGGWCHAESDNVNDRGEVVVEAGQRTNVWIFHCLETEGEPPAEATEAVK